MRRHALPILCCFALGAAPAVLAAERPNPYLSQARVYYLGLEYERCTERLQQATQWSSTPEEQVEIELYAGLCKFDLRQEKAAAEHFRMALRLNPSATLPAGTSPPIRKLFDSIAARMPKPEATAVAAPLPSTPVDAPTPEPRSVTLAPADPPPPVKGFDLPPPAPARGRSLLLPVTLGGAAVAVGITALVFGLQAKSFEAQSNLARKEIDAFELGNAARRDAIVSNVGSGVAGALGVGAILSWFLQPPPPEAPRSTP